MAVLLVRGIESKGKNFSGAWIHEYIMRLKLHNKGYTMAQLIMQGGSNVIQCLT